MTEDADVAEDKNESTGGIIKQTIDSATALTKAVPIYEDAIQPLAKEAGKALGTIGKAVNVALAPVSAVVWGYDQISDFLETKVSEKLENVPEDRISTPPPNVAGPAVEALKFTGHDETLREMFSNLIANSLDSKTVLEAHPSFVDMIRNLSSDEGLILRQFALEESFPLIDVKLVAIKDSGYHILQRNTSFIGSQSGCKNPQLTSNYLDNLCRLGILEIPTGQSINDPPKYEALKKLPTIEGLKKKYESSDTHRIELVNKCIITTGIGKQFISACVVDKRMKG